MVNGSMSRRRLLSLTGLAAATGGFAGCLDEGGDAGSDDTPTAEQAGGSGSEGTATDTSGSTSTERDSSSEPRSVSFEAPHGQTIDATAYGGGSCGVVLVPQINLDRPSWEPQATAIADRGYLALAIDEDPDDREASVRGAIRYLREEESVESVVLVGASSGGEAVVVANAKTDLEVAGTVTLSAAGGEDHAADLQGRSLFVVSKGDDDRFVRTARELHENAPDPKQLVEYEGSAHGQRIFESPNGEDLTDRIHGVIDDVC